VKAPTESSGEFSHTHANASMRACEQALTKEQLRAAQAVGPEGRHQEDHAFRPFHVLSANAPRDEAPEIFQPREHHLHSRHPEAAQLRDIYRGLPHSGTKKPLLSADDN
jgi:hypothetical protein